MENYKNKIASLINQMNDGFLGACSTTLTNIDNMVNWAWQNWDEDILSGYYAGEKPQQPTEKFIYDWVENEDFEADGFDIEYLEEMFGQ